MKPQKRSKPTRQRGFVFVFLAMTLVILLAFAAFAVDMGALYGARAAAQRAADAAALAGAFVYITEPTLSEADLNQLANDQAHITATKNSILDHTIVDSEVTVVPNAGERWVQVWITHHRETFFAKVLGWSAADVRVFAMAEAAVEGTSIKCAKPWFLPNTFLADAGVNPCSVAGVLPACPATQVVIDSAGNVTPFGTGKLGVPLNLKQISVGQGGQPLGPGNFYEINLLDSTGGKDYRLNIAMCTAQSTHCGDAVELDTLPGNRIGPTRDGTIGQPLGSPFRDPTYGYVEPLVDQPQDHWIADPVQTGRYLVGEYLSGLTGERVLASKQVVVIPIWDIKPFCKDSSGQPSCTGDPRLNGSEHVYIIGFARVFVEGMDGSHGVVYGHLVGVSGCNVPPDWNINTTESGPYGIPLRLVRPATQPTPPT